MAHAPPTRRRWFQFSVGTLLLLVTVFAVWLGWELKFIRDRQAWLRENAVLVDPEMRPDDVFPGGSYVIMPPLRLPPRYEASIPTWRKWLGDEAVPWIIEGEDWTDIDRARAVRLFPEAKLIPQRK